MPKHSNRILAHSEKLQADLNDALESLNGVEHLTSAGKITITALIGHGKVLAEKTTTYAHLLGLIESAINSGEGVVSALESVKELIELHHEDGPDLDLGNNGREKTG